jgi:hypothetical protein
LDSPGRHEAHVQEDVAELMEVGVAVLESAGDAIHRLTKVFTILAVLAGMEFVGERKGGAKLRLRHEGTPGWETSRRIA